MRVTHLFAAAVVAVSLSACASKPKAKPAPATPPLVSARQHAQRLEAKYQKTDPAAQVGVVLAVRPADHLAAVGDVPVKSFKTGDIVSFLDAAGKPLANGHVKHVEKNVLIVQYEALSKGRAPQVADLAVRLKSAK